MKYSRKSLKYKVNSLKWMLSILAFVIASNVSFAQLNKLDSIAQYDFVRYDLNKISVKDSNSLSSFFDKIWDFEENNYGKIKILQIGDSHVQAGYWSGEVREQIHKSFGCGTTERGFIFPFGMAHTNGPVNYAARYTGQWKGCRSAFIKQRCDWGVSGIVASTKDDSTTIKVYTNNHTYDSYWFDRIKVFHKDEQHAFKISIKPANGELVNIEQNEDAGYTEFLFSKETDTAYFTFLKKDQEEAEFIMQGLTLENSKPGLSYSEIGVNGAEVPSYLACGQFTNQLRALNPDLIVVSLGTNDTYSMSFNDSVFELKYDTLIQRIKEAAPYANILLTTPGDCKRYRKKYIKENIDARKVVFNLAKKHNCAVWDFFNIMGGFKSMDNWHASKLTSNDRVHLNETGYELQGQLMYNALAESYSNYTASRRPNVVIYKDGKNYEKFLWSLIKFNPKEPLFFNTYIFWGFFSIVYLIFSLIYKNFKLRNLFLFLVSIFIYYKAGGFYFILLIFSTITDFYIGNWIYKSVDQIKKKLLVGLSLFLNLGLLAFFKYSGFAIETINDLTGWAIESKDFFAGVNGFFDNGLEANKIVPVVGISFYTFQTISYAIDIYRARIEPVKNVIDFGFYVSFFPQLVAGPIVRANEFIPQIYKEFKLTINDFSRAAFLIVGGLFKKIVISDYISHNFVDRIFENPEKYSGLENLMGVYGYALQIYCDFSAYSDIAIGLALLMGFSLPENFRTPYLSTNITDFWRRWHMSLSRWLKDYLYIPLGGNKKGKVRTYINLFLTMLIGGLWHGAAFKFIIWGGLHGAALAIHKLFKTYVFKSDSNSILGKVLSWFITFNFVCFCWIYFRASDISVVKEIVHQIAFNFRADMLLEFIFGYRHVISIMALGFLLHLVPEQWELKIQKLFVKLKMPAIGITVVLMVFLIYQFKISGNQPFIYFQF